MGTPTGKRKASLSSLAATLDTRKRPLPADALPPPPNVTRAAASPAKGKAKPGRARPEPVTVEQIAAARQRFATRYARANGITPTAAWVAQATALLAAWELEQVAAAARREAGE